MDTPEKKKPLHKKIIEAGLKMEKVARPYLLLILTKVLEHFMN